MSNFYYTKLFSRKSVVPATSFSNVLDKNSILKKHHILCLNGLMARLEFGDGTLTTYSTITMEILPSSAFLTVKIQFF
jgi:hypothetical protein